jgi:hypothetical protein
VQPRHVNAPQFHRCTLWMLALSCSFNFPPFLWLQFSLLTIPIGPPFAKSLPVEFFQLVRGLTMSSDPTPVPRTFLVRFCDNFLQDRNIKWMLMVGMLILLGSSFLLVSAHWDTYTPAWKYAIFLAYTAAIFGMGQWTQRVALPRTATMLKALTVLLVPITFVVLHLVWREEADLFGRGFQFALGGVNLVLAVSAARAVFQHFLREHQPTFVICYLLLAVAGAVVPGLPAAWAPVLVLALWALFAAGSVKVNRHVFWLTEEHRAPRICGFLPMALLGAQFLMVFLLHAPQSFALEWFGLGSVLVAIPVLLTADAVACVFQKRTGNLVRPLPWSIIGPMVVGLTLCAGGVVLAATSVLPPSRPHALVLASGLAATLMAVVARRTGKQAFVWAMLAGVVLAYNFSPAFFIDTARALIVHSAEVIHEDKLPYAFYGLTYVPLLMAAMLGGWALRRPGSDLFGRPLRTFAVGLACVMLAVSVGHVKALVPVALVMTFLFTLQVILFRDGRLAVLAAVSWITAAGGGTAFASQVLGWAVPADLEIGFLAASALALLVAGLCTDSRTARLLPARISGNTSDVTARMWRNPCQVCSLVLTFFLAAFWLTGQAVMPVDASGWPSGGLVFALLLIQALRWAHRPEIRLPALILATWQALSLTIVFFGPPSALADLFEQNCAGLYLPLALAATTGLLAWQLWEIRRPSPWRDISEAHLWGLRAVAVLAVGGTLTWQVELAPADIWIAAAAFLMAFGAEIASACRRQSEERVWIAVGIAVAAAVYFAFFRVLPLGRGIAMFCVLGLGLMSWVIGEWVRERHPLVILHRPLHQLALVLPLVTVALGTYRHLFAPPAWLGANSLALLLAAAFYFWRGLERPSRAMLILSGLILNLAMALLWRELAWTDPQFFMIPMGISVLALVQLLKPEIPERCHDPLRYLGALVILVSPTFHIVGGSWLHLFSLMVASVGVMLVAMGLRVRALIYAGTAFLIADLIAMVVRGSIDNPNVLWIAGLAFGGAVIALGAVCERNREALVGRIRVLADTLKQWE